jgi:hypothetical protein
VPCGYRITLDFLAHPDAPDTSCVSDAPAVSFASTLEAAQEWFGTSDLWDNVPVDGGGAADSASAEAESGVPEPREAGTGGSEELEAGLAEAGALDAGGLDAAPEDTGVPDATE